MKHRLLNTLIVFCIALVCLLILREYNRFPIESSTDINPEIIPLIGPPPQAATYSWPYRMAIVGDFGDPSPSPATMVAALAGSWEPHAIVTTGDNNYPSGSMNTFATNTYAHFGKYIDSHTFFPTLGNHDWGYPDENSYTANTLPSSQYFSYLPGNRRYYSVVLANGLLKIIVLDTDRREPDLALQGQFLQSELSTGELYKLVFTHEPPYSSCEGKSSDRSLFPYKEWGATVVYSGHCHLYERLVDSQGMTYVVNGAGGGGQTDELNTAPPSGVTGVTQYNAAKGAILIQVYPEKIESFFFDVNNNLIDSFYINAGSQEAH